jgi:hypothetical protein
MHKVAEVWELKQHEAHNAQGRFALALFRNVTLNLQKQTWKYVAADCRTFSIVIHLKRSYKIISGAGIAQ